MGKELVSAYMHWRDLVAILQPGDLIEFRRGYSGSGAGIYQHWAVYMGFVDGKHRVIHFSNEDRLVAQSFNHFGEVSGNVEVQWELLEQVAGDCACRKNNAWDEVDTPRSQAEILRAAKEKLGEGGYHLATNNCEHFANYCRYGKKRSGQVERTAAGLGTAVAIVGVGAAVFALYDWWTSGKEEEEKKEDRSKQKKNESKSYRP